MDHDHEIRSLAAETLAVQTIVGQALFRITQGDPRLKNAITEALGDAANVVEQVAIQFGLEAHSDHTVKALQVVEEIRTVILGRSNQPKRGV